MNPEFLPYVVAAPAGLGALALAGGGWHRYRQRKAAAQVYVAPGAARLTGYLTQSGTPRAYGRLAMLLVGTYGVNEGYKIIEAFVRTGCEGDIGGIIAIELDERQRNRFLTRLAALSLALFRRARWCTSTLLAGGLQNRAIGEVESLELRRWWQVQVANTIEEGVRLIRATEHPIYTPSMQHGYDPAAILVVHGAGGHAALGAFAASQLQQQFPLATTYVVAVLPEHGVTRKEFFAGIQRYVEGQFVRWFLISDNRRNPLANDEAAALGLASLWGAPHLDDLPFEPWNALMHLAPRQLHGVVVPRFWYRKLPVKPNEAEPVSWFTIRDAVVRGVFEGLTALEREQAKGVALATPAADASRYVIVNLPLDHQSLVQVKDEVEAALHASGWFAADYSRRLVWSAISSPPHAARLSMVMLEAAVDGVAALETLLLDELTAPACQPVWHRVA